MDAIQFIGLLTEKYEKVPVFIVMTGLGDIQQAINMMKLGAKDYIIKDNSAISGTRFPLASTRMSPSYTSATMSWSARVTARTGFTNRGSYNFV